MKLNLSKDKVARIAVQVSLGLFLLAAGYAYMLHMQIGNFEAAQATSSKATHALTSVIGRIIGHKGASWCQPVVPPTSAGLY